ncbi:hypothetical protein PV08_03315 [Exophiala spinifera]|uniref:Uncharacterized protein n=1 Tax=Exophiala spinifera TaxID=91928 RepID=A0A0D2BKF3_9EURO|nr:uncharacterized protein PV08_03315 [Exophiala spinifera]KIW19025.1 hypothetical protein PV08_03315 [Exophiala spinifera]
MGPPGDPAGLSPPLSLKSSPYRKDPKSASVTLRTLYRTSAQDGQMPELEPHQTTTAILPTSPHLPPTPPGASNGEIHAAEDVVSDGTVFRSALVTPSNPNSPPTPDNTPPRQRKTPFVRPFLGSQPSPSSTRAESFTTAREDVGSEDGFEIASHYQGNLAWSQSSLHKASQPTQRLRHSSLPLSLLLYTENDTPGDEAYSPIDLSSSSNQRDRQFLLNGDESGNRLQSSPQPLSTSTTPIELKKGRTMPRQSDILSSKKPRDVKSAPEHPSDVQQDGLNRGKSLRDRLLDAQHQDPSASTEIFASIIGWNDSVPNEDALTNTQNDIRDSDRRLSGISTTSTIEAYVFEPVALPKRKMMLRHVNKHESLRSVSSPFPASNRDSVQSSSDSPHRLVHKKACLSNQNRWSFGSEISRSHSLASSAVLPKTEVIRVAVIPERSSSLPASNSSGSKKPSLSNGSARSQARKVSDNPPSAWQHKRTMSETVDRGRRTEQAPVVPPRSSSLSAPTSRSTSRANSITSENLRVRRQQAEKDLRKTLDRMESDRLLKGMRDWPLEHNGGALHTQDGSQVDHAFDQAAATTPSHSHAFLIPSTHDSELENNGLGLVVPGTLEWAALRPTSTLETPFSQPSFRSTSPEINEATAINFFPHNNHSLQLIEPYSVAESRAVREVQKQRLPHAEVDSPLRNPRSPPEPPQVKVIPPTPGDESEKRLAIDGVSSERATGLQWPGTYRRSDSWINTLSRGLSLKNARNRKADQDLDSQLNPFWRPRAFWDDIDHYRLELEQQHSRQIGVVNNSLGLPQEKTIVTGPVSLVRRISERRRQKRGLIKQTSHGSLARIRATRQFYASSGLSMRFHLAGIKNIQERILRARQRKEDGRREKRRADLRRSIGPNVVMQGDSRFPASNTRL